MMQSALSTSSQSDEVPCCQAIQPDAHHPLSEQLPHQCAKYHLIRPLGKGSQGKVWLAQDKETGEYFAIKQLNVHSAKTWKQYELFKREASVLEKLSMPGIAPFREYIEDLSGDPPFVCIVQKYIEGQTLAELLQKKHRFETETVYQIIYQTLKILQQLHQHEPPIVHRDIKPSNLMLTPKPDGTYDVTLLDFGAVSNPQVQNGGSTVAGTFGYMPPEQLMGQALPGSDIYALGAVAVELLSGVSPADMEVCDFKLLIEPHLTHLPPHVVQTLSLMLAPSLSLRLCDHHTLMAQFESFANHKKPTILSALRGTNAHDLNDVVSICQPGNYELWQSLDPNNLPAVPWTSTDLAQALNETKARIPIPDFIRYGAPAALLLMVLGFCLGITKMAILGIVLLIIFGASWPVKVIEHHMLTEKFNVLSPFSKGQISQNNIREIEHLMQKATKVVGKITYISYVYIKREHIEGFQRNHERTEFDAYYLLAPNKPIFYVRYQFQLNYNEHPISFYGELYTHTAPENHYKVGDPLTLLACLESKDSVITLTSIPYPYPFHDVLEISHICFKCEFPVDVLSNSTHSTRLHAIHSLPQSEATLIAAQCLGDENAVIARAESISTKSSSFPIKKHYYHLAIHMGHELAKKSYSDLYSKYIHQNIQSTSPILSAQALEKLYKSEEINNTKEIQKWRAVATILTDIDIQENNSISVKHDEVYLIYKEALKYEGQQNFSEAMKLYEQAANEGFSPAAYRLAVLYEDISKDHFQSIIWYTKAKKLGDSTAAAKLKLYFKDIQNDSHKCFKLASLYEKAKDIDNAIIWFENSANLKNANAALALGRIYQHQYKSTLEAIQWYQRAYELGATTAPFHIGSLYRDSGDPKSAIPWFEKAVEIDKDGVAASTLGRLYQIEFDYKENAQKWFKIAASMGNTYAESWLKNLGKT